MIVLDTNVVSEAMKPEPDAAVRAWLNDQTAETLYRSSVTLAELLFGIAALPTGKRKNMLTRALDGLLGLFEGRVLPFDVDAARALCRASSDGEKGRSRLSDAGRIYRSHCGFARIHGGVP